MASHPTPSFPLHSQELLPKTCIANLWVWGWTGQQLSSQGFSAYALDLRGRGKSDGKRFYAESFDDYVKDVKAVVDLVRAGNACRRIFLLGHSAGGVVACSYALKHGNDLAGLICESFAFKLPAPDFALAAITLVNRFAPRMRMVSLDNGKFSRDPAVVAALYSDPLIAREAQPAATIAALVRANAGLDEQFHAIRLPLMILHGSDDKITVPRGSEVFYEMAGSTDKILRLYKGHVHDLLNDLGKEEVLADIVTWIRAHS